eukprot:TRINITY_DN10702_c0_g1_i1.p1 TRINITY_DN10702_c0_g1~~TRINITY_DN10702_c0_g1_i1.p1  ORF type:complete len:207 (+),score=57.62 TRINITY_DN10702_c0_g1_i1:69-623(+)
MNKRLTELEAGMVPSSKEAEQQQGSLLFYKTVFISAEKSKVEPPLGFPGEHWPDLFFGFYCVPTADGKEKWIGSLQYFTRYGLNEVRILYPTQLLKYSRKKKKGEEKDFHFRGVSWQEDPYLEELKESSVSEPTEIVEWLQRQLLVRFWLTHPQWLVEENVRDNFFSNLTSFMYADKIQEREIQ